MFGAWKAICDEEGASLIELAFVMFFLFPPMLLGIVDVGFIEYASVENASAARAGAAYAAQYYIQSQSPGPPTLPTVANVTTAVTNDSPELQNMQETGTNFIVTMSTGCNGGAATTGNTVPVCSPTTVLPFVTVTTQSTVMPLIKFKGLIGPFTINNSATINLVN
jgi:Flp pilus assembly protein TadG